MSPVLKAILILLALMCCIQYAHMARIKRGDGGSSAKNGKSADNLDVNALSGMIMNRLKDSVKNGGDSIKNIVNTASNSLQQRGLRASVGILL